MDTVGYAPRYFLNEPQYQSQRRHGIINLNTCTGVVFNITTRSTHTDVRGPIMAPGEEVKFWCRDDGGGTQKYSDGKLSKAQD